MKIMKAKSDFSKYRSLQKSGAKNRAFFDLDESVSALYGKATAVLNRLKK